MAITELEFNPATGLNDSSVFPDPASEQETREQLQELHDQTRDYINNTLIPEITTEAAGLIELSDGSTVQQAIDSLESNKISSTSMARMEIDTNDRTLSFSVDGSSMIKVAQGRPTVYVGDTPYPDRKQWAFLNTDVTYDNDKIYITAAKGDKGDPGADGTSFKVLGHFDAVADLPVQGSAGDAYQVGLTEPYPVYIWDSIHNEWYNGGVLAGAKGDKGDKGDRGDTGFGLPSGGTTGQIIVKDSATDYDTAWANMPALDTATWGNISGTLANQTDLITALAAYVRYINNVGPDATGNIAVNLGTTYNVTLAAADWSSNYYVLSGLSYIVASKTMALTYPPTLSDTDYTALRDAQIRVTAVADGTMTLRALGTQPTRDITIQIVVWG